MAAHRSGEPYLAPFRRGTPIALPLAAFVGLSALACFFSTQPSRSIPELKGLLTFALVPLTLALVRDEKDADLLVDLWRLATLIMVVDGLTQYLGGADTVVIRVMGWQSIYMTYAGLLTGLTLVLLGRAASSGRPRGSRAWDLAVGALGVTAVALTFTRSALLGVLAGLLTLLLVARPRLLPVFPVAALLFYLAMPGNVRDRVRSSFDANDETVRDRILIWKAGANMVKDHPLFGVGPGRVKELYRSYALPGAINMTPGHLHDNVLMTAADTGVPSAVAYLWLLGAFGVGAIRRARRGGASAPASRAALAAVVGLFVAGLFEYNFGDVEILRATLVLLALPFAVADPEPPPDPAPDPAT